jgi:hypothetical protein
VSRLIDTARPAVNDRPRQPKRPFLAEESASLDMYPWAVSLLEGIAADSGWSFEDKRPGDEGYRERCFMATATVLVPVEDEALLHTTMCDLRRLVHGTLRQAGAWSTSTATLMASHWEVRVSVVSAYRAPAARPALESI